MRRIALFGSVGAALLIAVAAYIGWRGTAPSSRPPMPPVAASAPAPTATLPGTAAAPAASQPATNPPRPAEMPPPKPSFDVVTVDPQGHAVIAGRAAPGDRVRVFDGDKPLGEVTADARGEWVLVPSAPLAPGDRQISAEATGRDGGLARRSADVVALSVNPAAPGEPKGAALAVLLPGDAEKPAQLLQRPNPAAGGETLALDTAEYAGKRLALSGHAEPGTRVAIYAGNRLLGTAMADAAGRWSLVSPERAPAGGTELRLDQLAADGGVIRRIAAAVPPPAELAAAGRQQYIVRPGNSLWLIARHVYGEGMRYTAIYAANRDVIRDPNLIYPGQLVRLPR